MLKESLHIYTIAEDGNKKLFPSSDEPSILSEWTYTAERMAGAPTITCSLMHRLCLDDLWSKKEFVEFNGERYYVDQIPTSSKNTEDVRYKHDITFVSERIALENVFFFDVVTEETETQYKDRYRSNGTKLNFYGTLNELVSRLNDSLIYSKLYEPGTGDGYHIVIDDGISVSEEKEISLEKVYFTTALQEIYNKFETPYYWVGKTCHIGYAENSIAIPFEYGQGNGLISITKTNENFRIINRITGAGSSDNIPYYYPNKSADRNDPANGGVWITPTGRLMPPIYIESKGADRFYNALNNTYINPDGGHYSFNNPYIVGNPMEGIQDFENIKPSIKGMKNAAGQLIGQISDIAFDSDDSDEVDDNGDYIHSYFYVKLHIFNGTYGFNLFKQAIAQGSMTFNMTSGNCAPCDFEVGVSEPKLVDGHYEFDNPVQVDDNGDIVDGSYADKVKFGNIQPQQQDTSKYEVWVALKKDINTFGVVMPSVTNNYKPNVGDTFVITNILLPQVYITYAQNELKDALIKCMSENNDEKFSFNITLSRIYLQQNPEISYMLNENARLIIRYNEHEYTLYVSSYSCKSTDDILNEITVDVTSEFSVGQSALRDKIAEVTHEVLNGKSSQDYLALAQKYFLSKKQNDIARGVISFLKRSIHHLGVQFGKSFAPGMTGFGGMIDGDGNGELESLVLRRFLETPEFRFNRAQVILGDFWMAPGGGTIEKVVQDVDEDGEVKNTGTIWLKLEDGEIGAIDEDDICMGFFHDFSDSSNNATTDSDDGMGNRTLSGFCTVYFRVQEIIDKDISTKRNVFTYVLRGEDERWKHSFHPFEMMRFVAYGNFTSKSRQASGYITRKYARFLTGVNDWEFTESMIGMQWGDLSNLVVFGKDMSGYSAYLNNVYFSGTIEQINNSAHRMDIVQSAGGWLNDPNGIQTITCTVTDFFGKDVTSEYTTWWLTRDSGDAAADTAWNAQHTSVDATFQIAYSDLNIKGDSRSSTLFTVKCSNDNDGRETRGTFLARRLPNDGADGRGVLNTVIEYQIGTSGTTAPTGTWSTSLPSPQQGKYLWTRTTVTYTSGSPSIIYTVAYYATNGTNGKDGIPGKDGTKLVSTKIEYAASSNGTAAPSSGWQNTIPNVPAGQYLWTKTTWTYSDGTNEVGYSVARQGADGAKGDKGDQGIKGDTGTGVSGVTSYYAISDLPSGVTRSNTTGWVKGVFQQPTADKPYAWKYVETAYTNGKDPTYSDCELVYTYDAGVNANLLEDTDFRDDDHMGAWGVIQETEWDGVITVPEEDYLGGILPQALQGRNAFRGGTWLGFNKTSGKFVLGQKISDKLLPSTWYTLSYWLKCSQEKLNHAPITSAGYGYGFTEYHVLLIKGYRYRFEVVGHVSQAAASAGKTLRAFIFNSDWSWQKHVDIGTTDSDRVTLTFSDVPVTEDYKINFYSYPNDHNTDAKVTLEAVYLKNLSEQARMSFGSNIVDTSVKGFVDGVERTVDADGISYGSDDDYFGFHTYTFKTKATIPADGNLTLLLFPHAVLYSDKPGENPGAVHVDICMPKIEEGMMATGYVANEKSLIGDTGPKGDKGDKGEQGPSGPQGPAGMDGCIQRIFNSDAFQAGYTYRNDSELAVAGLKYIDYMAEEDETLSTGWRIWMCDATHDAAASWDDDKSMWTQVSANASSAFFTNLIAKNATVKLLNAAQVVATDNNGVPLAGLVNGNFPLWVGDQVNGLSENAPFRVNRSGKMFATGAEISGTITADSGSIGDFSISQGRLVATSGTENDVMLMSLQSDYILFKHDDELRNKHIHVQIGSHSLSGIGGDTFTTPFSISVNRTPTSTVDRFSNVGINLDIKGAPHYDDGGLDVSGNCAIYIKRGFVAGFRPYTRRISANTTLSTMDNVILVMATNLITITLPTEPQDGQLYYIKNIASGARFTLVPGSSSHKISNKAGGADSSWTVNDGTIVMAVFDEYNKRWHCGWSNTF